MPRLAHVLVAAILLGALPGLVTAQKPVSVNPSVSTKYDRFEDTTTADLTIRIGDQDDDYLVVTLSGQYTGAVPKSPPKIVLLVQTLRLLGYTKCADICPLNVIADDARFKFLVTTPPSGGSQNREGAMYITTLGGWVDYSDFREVARAKRIEMRFGDREFTLTSLQMDALRRFFMYFGDDVKADAPRN